MKLSVHLGKWKTSSKNDIICISATNKFGISAGDIIKTSRIRGITVSAVLTDPCYLPGFSSWSSSGGIENNFYTKYSIKYYDSQVDYDSLELFISESDIVIVIIFVLNFIIPVFIIKNKTPIEIIREGNL